MRGYFARRTSWNLTPNRYTRALEEHRAAGREVLDLTASNPTTVGLKYREGELLRALADPHALTYEPRPKGLLAAREAVTKYYAERRNAVSRNDVEFRDDESPHPSKRRVGGAPASDSSSTTVSPDDVILTASTSEAYSFLFRLLCEPGDSVLVPTPSYPLFEFLADLQDVKLAPYELIYDHGWQIDFHSLQTALERTQSHEGRCRAILVVQPNNPTGSYVKSHELEELNRICRANDLALIADEVFLDYSLVECRSGGAQSAEREGDRFPSKPPITFASNRDVLTFTLSGLSKISALPQMKLAWMVASGPEPLKREALARLEVIADTYLSVSAPVQWATSAMLEQRHDLQAQLLERIRANLAELDSQLAAQTTCSRLQVEGGWYAVLRVPVTRSDEELAIQLLQQTGVLLQPGHFYNFAAEGHLVISLITPSATFAEGIRRVLSWVADA